jgi:hypothetical protein
VKAHTDEPKGRAFVANMRRGFSLLAGDGVVQSRIRVAALLCLEFTS